MIEKIKMFFEILTVEIKSLFVRSIRQNKELLIKIIKETYKKVK
jgi:hypothetical protein